MIGFDIGGTKCSVSLGIEKGDGIELIDKIKIPTDLSVSPYEMIDRMCSLADGLTRKVEAVGISCGGPLDSKKGIILSPPNLPGWDDVKIVEYLKSRYIDAKVNLENDANACAVSEWKYGAGRGSRNMIFLTFGTGMGAGLIINGRLYRGTNGNAGEVGHIRLTKTGPWGYGKHGSFEGYVSGGAIGRISRKIAEEYLNNGKSVAFCSNRDELDSVSAAEVAKCAKEGDELSLSIFKECGEYLGEALSILVDILNPEKIVIGSIYAKCGELMRDAMLEVMRKECLSSTFEAVSIVPAQLCENVGDIAALSVATL